VRTKRFEGATEQEALEKVRDELGLSAIVLSIKKKNERGIKRIFTKPTVIVTAAYDENEQKRDKVLAAALKAAQDARDKGSALSEDLLPVLSDIPEINDDMPSVAEAIEKEIAISRQQQHIRELESQMQNNEEMVAQLMSRLAMAEAAASSTPGGTGAEKRYANQMLQMFFDCLLSHGVVPEIASVVLEDAETLSISTEEDINMVAKIVYNKIMSLLGEPRTLIGSGERINRGETQIAVFMGPTGVGKTTTIAKQSSLLLLNEQKQVGFITADTYRIAAVEQLRTYADILGLDLRVIYSGEEITNHVNIMSKNHDVILVDTAGRSHNNTDNIDELNIMLECVPTADKFLVLSATTRQDDILSIIKAYDNVADFDLIFTKLDETKSLGVLLNTCYLTGKRISYITNGQNVPDDIAVFQADRITKSLLAMTIAAGGEA